MTPWIVIPARLNSTRLPGKALLDMHGRSMLERAWLMAINAKLGPVLIASSDAEILQAASRFGANVFQTDAADSGTSRIAQIVNQLPLDDADLVINLQCDEPFLPVTLLRDLVQFAEQHPTHAAYSVFTENHSNEHLQSSSVVKVVCDRKQRALYFSRAALQTSTNSFNHHHGIYAYRANTLRQWPSLTPGPLERQEKLEQLRLLENGLSIGMLQHKGELLPGIDTHEDYERALQWLTTTFSD